MGVLYNGKYYKDGEEIPSELPPIAKQAQLSALAIDAQKHDRELVQPYLPDGQLNPEFEKHYPEVVQEWRDKGYAKKGETII